MFDFLKARVTYKDVYPWMFSPSGTSIVEYNTDHPYEALMEANYWGDAVDKFNGDMDFIVARDKKREWMAILEVTQIEQDQRRVFVRPLKVVYDYRDKAEVASIKRMRDAQLAQPVYRVDFNQQTQKYDIVGGPPGKEARLHDAKDGYMSRDKALKEIEELKKVDEQQLQAAIDGDPKRKTLSAKTAA